jgi:hypothetical protein
MITKNMYKGKWRRSAIVIIFLSVPPFFLLPENVTHSFVTKYLKPNERRRTEQILVRTLQYSHRMHTTWRRSVQRRHFITSFKNSIAFLSGQREKCAPQYCYQLFSNLIMKLHCSEGERTRQKPGRLFYQKKVHTVISHCMVLLLFYFLNLDHTLNILPQQN